MLRSRYSPLSAGTRGSVFVAVLGASALFGCDPEPVFNPNVSATAPTAAPATIYFVNAATDLPAVDVYLEGATDKTQKFKLELVGYRKVATALNSLPPMTYKVDVRPGGAAVTSMPVLSQSVVLQSGRKVLLATVGRAAETAGATKLALSAVDLGTPSASGVKLRVLQASPSAPLLDLVQSTKKVIRGAEFGRATPYAEFSGELAGSTAFMLRPFTEVEEDATDNLVSVTVPSKYGVGSVLTAIAFGEINPLADEKTFLGFSALDESKGTLVDLPMTIDTTGKSKLIAVHASPDAPAVDLFRKNGAMLLSGLAYQKASVEVELPGGVYDVDVKPAGLPTAIVSTQLRLLPSTNWTIYATGLVNTGGAAEKAVKFLAVRRAEKGDATQLRIVHTSPGTAPLDVKAGTQSLASKLAYPWASAYVSGELQGNLLKFVTTVDPKKAWDVTVPQALLTGGDVLSLFATGIPGDAMKPFSVFAVVESKAAAMTPASTVVLTTVAGTPPM